MSINNANLPLPYTKFVSNDDSDECTPPTPRHMNVETGIKFGDYYGGTIIDRCCYCNNSRFKWCNIHWKCCCCKCRLCVCMIAFWIFLFLSLTFLLVIAYLGGYIFQTIPIKPPCCINNNKHKTKCKIFDYNGWDDTLNNIVKQRGYVDGIDSTLIDYKSLDNKTSPLNKQFNEFIRNISRFDVSSLDCNEQFAFYINVYNAFAIKMVLDHKKDNGDFVNSITDITEYFGLRSVWKMNAGKIDGVEYTLDNIEHDTLRTYWSDSRMHATIVCASLSCPDFIGQAYKGNIIEQQLLSSFRMWTNNTSKGMRIDGNTLYLSMIFGWYQHDFMPNVKTFITQYMMDNNTKQSIENAEDIQYFEYDWNLNIFTLLY